VVFGGEGFGNVACEIQGEVLTVEYCLVLGDVNGVGGLLECFGGFRVGLVS
jgi:hypothetical protein